MDQCDLSWWVLCKMSNIVMMKLQEFLNSKDFLICLFDRNCLFLFYIFFVILFEWIAVVVQINTCPAVISYVFSLSPFIDCWLFFPAPFVNVLSSHQKHSCDKCFLISPLWTCHSYTCIFTLSCFILPFLGSSLSFHLLHDKHWLLC